MRHGLDMAFSENHTQLKDYGRFFDIDIQDATTSLASKQLDYWIRANRNALQACDVHLAGRYLVINYDALCARPTATIRQLFQFLGITPDEAMVDQLSSSISPTSVRRFQSQDLSQFSEKQMLAVRKMGFEI
jgi:hypothetical protein